MIKIVRYDKVFLDLLRFEKVVLAVAVVVAVTVTVAVAVAVVAVADIAAVAVAVNVAIVIEVVNVFPLENEDGISVANLFLSDWMIYLKGTQLQHRPQ